jgi:hypothetical protein
MAQSVCTASGGNISFSGTNQGYRLGAHVLTIITDINDATGFSSANWEESEEGLRRGDWSADGTLTYGTTADQPAGTNTIGTVTLTYATGCTMAFTARRGSEQLSASVRDNGRVRLGGRTSGAITKTWATS